MRMVLYGGNCTVLSFCCLYYILYLEDSTRERCKGDSAFQSRESIRRLIFCSHKKRATALLSECEVAELTAWLLRQEN